MKTMKTMKIMKTLNTSRLWVLVLLLGVMGMIAEAAQVKLSVSAGKPLVQAGSRQVNYLKIGLTGFPIEAEKERSPVNLAIVIDRSGSMSGEKLEHAREAAVMVIQRLAPQDIVSVVAYDSQVTTLVPATRVSDRGSIIQAIRSLTAGSNTALFAGVSKGAKEVRKFLDRRYVNRIILLSDGLANEGPSSPEELGDLGASLGREGISVTTFGLGLGYNEDLMMKLARYSDGNHAFIEKPADLARVFNLELGDVMSVVAQEVKIEINCRNLKPLKVLGREAEIRGNTITASLNQLYSQQEKFLLVMVETSGEELLVPEIEVGATYVNMKTQVADKLSERLLVTYSRDADEVAKRENSEVMVAAVNLLANEQYKVATRLRDEGKTEEARKTLETNRAYLLENAGRYKSKALEKFSEQNEIDAKNLDEKSWNKTRKNMRKFQQTEDYQQSY
jgi:Ca-activated chloride channel family protein